MFCCLQHCSLPTGSDESSADVTIHIIRTARATGVRLAVRLPPACLHDVDDGW